MKWVTRLACRIAGHRFKTLAEFKRRCTRCGREEWVMTRPYPLIGQAKSYWHHMDWDR